MHAIKAEYGHPQRSQHSFVITLGTPRNGSWVATLADQLKQYLGMGDDLLKSLTDNNLYLRMLRNFSNRTAGKSLRYECRPLLLYVGYEDVLFRIVPGSSAADEETMHLARHVKGFNLDHSEIVKPESETSEVYRWVNDNIADAFRMLDHWDNAPGRPNLPLCTQVPFVAETRFPHALYPAHQWLRRDNSRP